MRWKRRSEIYLGRLNPRDEPSWRGVVSASHTKMKQIYIVLCVLGFALPYYFFVPFVFENGIDLSLVLKQLFANPISSFFGVDVIVSSLVLWAFIYSEIRRRSIKFWWLSLIANLSVGVSLALPLFLLLREIELEKQK
jgi:hypothetical protein